MVKLSSNYISLSSNYIDNPKAPNEFYILVMKHVLHMLCVPLGPEFRPCHPLTAFATRPTCPLDIAERAQRPRRS